MKYHLLYFRKMARLKNRRSSFNVEKMLIMQRFSLYTMLLSLSYPRLERIAVFNGMYNATESTLYAYCLSFLSQPLTWASHLQLLLQNTLHPPLHRIQIFRRRNIILFPRLPTCQRQILGHNAILIHSINTSLFQALRKCHHFGRLIQRSPLHKTACPGEDGSDGVGGGRIAFLVLAVVTGDGAMGSF